ncbi:MULTISPECIES: lipase family protein [Streptomyces]|uniref:Secreted protein n=2 Tax=Streptomyces TaxID=1883 RepID=Q9L181_STRCO|nr:MULTISPECIES: lipase family protein [Streptomyces]WOY96306.1 alpha/beta fold hydrolase [Streptomyces violaceoruber]MDX2927172.1 alpha/beta fold hydrolase [Streptomyces sp. NRRL_B-16638]MDX3407683.1 alpha/beta fold hydrolase [Streptomyces sp. ME02-6977A]MYU46900.1 alpha/beta fold hydrolase [Streptomyces sp. SID7813]NSL80116.1 alpha/beta fold hydrolase [Streptomyces coelicolor]
MPPRPRMLAAAITAALALGAQAVPAAAADGPAGDSTATTSRGVEIPAFYTPPSELPAADGTLIRHEPLPLALSLPGIDGPLPGRATRLMYKSTDANGEAVAVTGAYVEPAAKWRGDGPRPLVAVAPGTMGQGDQCAASMALEHPLQLNGQTVSVGYEDLSVYRLLLRGVAVVVTDYVGLGTTDRLHTYVNRVDGAHAVLDAVRAARSLDSASVTSDSRVGLFGYSQGGGATAAAAELQPSYAPDVQLAGTYAGAPPADLTEVTKAIDGSDLAGALGWSLNGFLQTEPALRPIADRYINEAGQEALKDLSTMCVGDALFGYGGDSSTDWTRTGQSISDVIRAEPALQSFLAEQRIGSTAPGSPVRVATGVSDDLVPHGQARRLAVDWCGKGGKVTYVPVLIPGVGSGLLNHFAPLLADQGNAIAWLTDRLSGEPAGSNCWSMPVQP